LKVAPAKAKAAEAAYNHLREMLKHASRVGIGTGSTVKLVLENLLSDPETRSILERVKLYASSFDTLLYLRSRGLEASHLLPREPLDVYFDGADEVAVQASMCMAVKGRGAAMTREKILAYNAKYTLIVVDESKFSKTLGEKGKPVPVEVLPPALDPLISVLEARGIEARVRDECGCRDGPAITDNYGFIIDTWPWGKINIFEYESLLDTTPGVIGHGLFIGYMDEIIIGYQNEAKIVKCRRTRKRL
jgi:ribose 5-phosphate isomerase A